jgi:aminoglycoside phosphotransferase (APT) family kinase protein
MRYVDGETLGGRIVRSPALAAARSRLAFQCGEVLARIHAMTPPADHPLPLKPATILLDEIRAVRELEHWPRPVFDLAIRWLEAHAPEPGRQTLVHGDFRNGNLIVGPDGIRAVLDWEIAQLGDPMQDLGWLCTNSWRFGGLDQPVGGFGQRDDLFAGYASVSGTVVDAGRVRFWEMLGSLRWGVMCTMSTIKFRAGAGGDIGVELPMIARRASETELDLLNLLGAA